MKLPNTFKGQIESVFNFTETKIRDMKNYFCNTICGNVGCSQELQHCNKIAVSDYKKSKVTFNRTLHATRIINNHITYIDVFREFILRYKFEEIEDRALLLDFHRDTQLYLINYIEKYVKLFDELSHDSVVDDGRKDIFRNITKNIEKARAELENYIEIPIAELADNSRERTYKKNFVKIRFEKQKES